MPVIDLILNGNTVSVDADDDEELLWVLHDRLGIKGQRYGCGLGLCGACTATSTASPKLHPVQHAWIDNDVAQCGYCRCGTYFRIRFAIKAVAAGKYHGDRRASADLPTSLWGTAPG